MAPCPFGEIGNRQYTASQDGIARASATTLAFSHARNSVANFMVNQAYGFDSMSNETRARYEDLLAAYDHGILVGNLLGNLTSPSGDLDGLANIAKGTMELARLSGGRLENLKGWRESLDWYLEEMTDVDLKALTEGVLSSANAWRALMEQIFRHDAGSQAMELLLKVMAAVGHEMVPRMHSRLIVDFLNDMLAMANDTKDHAKIAERLALLGELSQGNLASLKGMQESLFSYVKELNDSDFYNLYFGWGSDDVEVILDKISKNVDDPSRRRALQALDCIRDALKVRGLKNVRESWTQLGELLSVDKTDRQDLKESLLHVCKWLYPADDTYETLSEEQQNKVRIIMQEEKLNERLMALDEDNTDEAKQTSVRLKEFHAWAKAIVQKPDPSV